MFNTAKEVISVFREVILCYTATQDHTKALKQIFTLLQNHFPLEGISFHQFDPVHCRLKLLFCVTEHDLYYIEKSLPLTEEEVALIYAEEVQPGQISLINHSMETPRAVHYTKLVSHLLPYRDRAILRGNLSMWGRLIGRMVFLGTAPDVFTKEQIEQFEPLLGPFSVLLTSMLKISREQPAAPELSHNSGNLLEQGFFPYAGAERGLKTVLETVQHLAGQEVPVLIRGETGTGKELIADAIQRISPRHNAPFIKMNCGAMPDTLLDSETFGFEKGAFTGATSAHQGKFEQADRGTLFLDEVGDLSLQAQIRLLRILQDGLVQRIGGYRAIPVNVRIIAATNRPLEAMIRKGLFREDLYYRLNVFPIFLPPLRERSDDIPELIQYFARRESKRRRLSQAPRPGPRTIEALMAYPWPGNIRELENLVLRAMIFSPDGPLLLENFLPPRDMWDLRPPAEPAAATDIGFSACAGCASACATSGNGATQPASRSPRFRSDDAATSAPRDMRRESPPETARGVPDRRGPQPRALDEIQREHIWDALCYCNGKVSGPGGAAELLELNPATLRKKMQRLGIDVGSRKKPPLSETSQPIAETVPPDCRQAGRHV